MGNEYFLYRHIREDNNEVFYIGIGTVNNKRKDLKNSFLRAFKKVNRSSFWNNIISKTSYFVEIIFRCYDRNLIIKKEKEFIALYGRKENGGTLCNLTDGGEGLNGFRHSVCSKIKIGESSRTRKRKRGYKILISDTEKKIRSNRLSEIARNKDYNLKKSESLKGNTNGRFKKMSESEKSKIRDRQNIPLYQFNLNGEIIRRFSSFTEAKSFGFHYSGIQRNLTGKTNNYKGFIWKTSI